MPKRDPVLKARSRELRANQTPAETALWRLLRAHQFDGVKFVRQHVVGPYILDFAARAHKLAIEVDGNTHGARTGYDDARTRYLEEQGYRVIRFTNAEVLQNPEGVAHAITAALASPSPPLPTLSPQGRVGSALVAPAEAGASADGAPRRHQVPPSPLPGRRRGDAGTPEGKLP